VPENQFQPDEAIRKAVHAADRRRRGRDAMHRVWRAAPVLAATSLAIAAVRRWTGWPAMLPVGILLTGAAALITYVALSRRTRAISDAAASAIDSDAGLRGELRSASWFVARDTRDAWADFHLARAAERLKGIDWSELYPSVRATRARIATLVMVIAVIASSIMLPGRSNLAATTAAAATPGPEPLKLDVAPDGTVMLPPELQKQLEALLAAAETGSLKNAEALMNSADLRDVLKQIAELKDPDLLAALARAMNGTDAQKPAITDMKALADRAKRAAEMSEMSREMRDALEGLAEELEQQAMSTKDNSDDSDGEMVSMKGPQKGESGQSKSGSGSEELSIQFAKDGSAGGGAGVMMMADLDDQAAGPPGAGVGGSGSNEAAASLAKIEAALHEEVVEASQDNPGSDIDTDLRRKSEEGKATVGFTHGASGKFDQSHTTAPPPVPEARRSNVETYFIRKQK
jgi:hypothetical protein